MSIDWYYFCNISLFWHTFNIQPSKLTISNILLWRFFKVLLSLNFLHTGDPPTGEVKYSLRAEYGSAQEQGTEIVICNSRGCRSAPVQAARLPLFAPLKLYKSPPLLRVIMMLMSFRQSHSLFSSVPFKVTPKISFTYIFIRQANFIALFVIGHLIWNSV